MMHLVQHRLDLVELAFDRLQPLGHADHLRSARQVHREQVFLHLPAHGLPDRGRIVALVGHCALSRKVTSACHASLVFGPYHTVAAGRSTTATASAVRETMP